MMSRKRKSQAVEPVEVPESGADVETPENMNVVDVPDEVAAAIEELQQSRDEAIAARQRALADFANFQRRATENERRAHSQGVTDVVRGLINVLDNFDLALQQDQSTLTVEQFANGMQMVRAEFGKVLGQKGVVRIEPETGEAFDPMQHEAMMRQPAEDIEPDHVVAVLQPGYAMGDLIVRPAKVILAEQPAED